MHEGQFARLDDGMNVRQIAVFAAALLAAVMALFLVRGMTQRPAPVAVAAPPVERTMALMVAKPLTRGQSVLASDLRWAEWAPGSTPEGMIIQSKRAGAIEEFSGSVARVDMLAGEPVFEERLVKTGDQGFMAAVLQPGYRAVSVTIKQETAAAGFVLPNDRVDVLATGTITIGSEASSRSVVRSDVVLEDVRVLAIDQIFETPKGEAGKPAAVTGAVATLELSPDDAQVLATAAKIGEVSLVLRGLRAEDKNAAAIASSAHPRAPILQQAVARDTVLVHAGGQLVTAQSGGP